MSVGVGYDLEPSTYSPAGRVFQVEYAQKKVDAPTSGTVVGIKCTDGVVLGVEKIVPSKMLCKTSGRQIFTLAPHAGMAATGFLPDCRTIANIARKEAANYKDYYAVNVPGHVLADRVALYVSQRTETFWYRVFGASTVLATYDEKGPRLFMVDPAGETYQYFAVAIGKGLRQAKVKLEKLDLATMTCRQACVEIAKIMHYVHDDVKDKPFELNLSWICEESKWEHRRVPEEIVAAADSEGRSAADGSDSDDDDDDDDEE